jgi:hypothetical protein
MITILSQPTLIQPVYNPIYITVSSDKTNEESFMFVFDLYVNGVFVNRDRLLPRPGTNKTIYSPARILESYVSDDKTQNNSIAVASTNCIDMYEVKCKEEYVNYWHFYDNSVDTLSSTSYTLLYSNTGELQPFAINDYVVVIQDPGYTYAGYNGVHKVTNTSSTSILININHINTVVNGGKVTYADKRKTIYSAYQLITDTSFNAPTSWTSYGPDVNSNRFYVNSGELKFEQANVTTMPNSTISSIPTVLIPGTVYNCSITVSNILNPSNGAFYFVILVGGNGYTISGSITPITYTFSVTCGTGTDFKIFVDMSLSNTATFGAHHLRFSDVTCTGETNLTGYDFNGVIQYEEIANGWNYTKYKLQNNTSKFLTNKPLTVKTSINDRGSISFMNIQTLTSGEKYWMRVIEQPSNITTLIPIVALETQPNTNSKILSCGIYPYNINLYSTIITNTTKSYSIQIINEIDPIGNPGNYSDISEIKYFELSDDCSRFEPIRFMFLNSLGAYDYYNATLLSRTNINIQRDAFIKTLEPGFVIGDRGKTNININAQESYIINTDWISEETAKWLSYEFFTSKEIYTIDSNGVNTPIILDNNSVEVKKTVNDKLLNYVFNFTKAIPINTTRN